MRIRTAVVVAVILPVAACAVGPNYKRPPPATDPTPAYKEVNGVLFRPALPLDTVDRGPWWTIYADPTLDRLMAQVEVSNQTLKENEAAYRQAVALIRQNQASYFPTFGYSGALQKSSSSSSSSGSGTTVITGSNNGSIGQFSFGGTMTWEIDVWGRIRRTVEEYAAAAQASAADLAAARLSTQSSLATSYFSLRISDDRRDLYRRSIDAFARALEIVRNQMNAGTASRLDLAQAQTQLEQTRALYAAEGANRAQFEHAIAALVGKMPAEVSIGSAPSPRNVPTLEAGAPSTLLERRPDIASAERQMQSANAQIGVAQAGYYPQFNFSASITFLSGMLSNLLQAGPATWAVGPQVAGTAFEGGAIAAQVEGARAAYDKTVATYRQTVLTAFQQVEDALAQQNFFSEQEEIQQRAVNAAREAERLSLNQYQAGLVAYTTVVTAQQTALSAEQTLINIRLNRLTASATLVTALGGGWRESDLPALIPTAPKVLPKASPVRTGWWPF